MFLTSTLLASRNATLRVHAHGKIYTLNYISPLHDVLREPEGGRRGAIEDESLLPEETQTLPRGICRGTSKNV